ncbi:MAG: bifunctional 5,10-methylenetetrahydrofolate dehydrogenase/5,10-methenyltetrahydrofolate cyclohydrolase [Anaerolineae bacterium]|nr:bifunctional 5,10-methylenetetrahydrofolate dehydrogenase/5,10-methenyltetrahydrofolate cyclohydrolase [Anaerolineae bacterium]
MTAIVIDGNLIAEQIRAEVKAKAAAFTKKTGYPPGLGAVFAGDNPASAQYVRMKRRACEQVGFHSAAQIMPDTCTQGEVEAAVKLLNDDPYIHGILVQLPLPAHIDEEAVLRMVNLDKDVDGFHPINIGLLGMKGREPSFTPATPTGCMVLLEAAGVNLEGANAVVIGRSNIVGLPMALMLMKANATVTVCHSRTRDIQRHVREADVVIAAIGKPHFVQGNWLKPGAVVIDVGTNRIDDSNDPRGYRFVGDVDFDSALHVAGAISKVPGGVGPMTITMLLANTLKAAARFADNARPNVEG